MDGRGTFIKVYRKSLDNPLFEAKPFDKWHAFCYLLLKARAEPQDVILKGKVVHLERGQWICSTNKLAETFGWSRGKVNRFLDLLENMKIVSVNGTALGTIISIENYTFYQDRETEDGTTLDTSDGTSNGTSNGTQKKKGKERKRKEKNIYSAEIETIVAHLNEVAHRHFQAETETTAKPIRCRLKDGYTVEDCIRVIDVKTQEWINSAKMRKFLQPETLFGKDNFERYVKQRPTTGNEFADAVLYGEIEGGELPF